MRSWGSSQRCRRELSRELLGQVRDRVVFFVFTRFSGESAREA